MVYSVLTGYRQYETWVPDVARSRLLAREGEIAIAEFIAPPYGPDKLVLEFIESTPASVVFTQVDRLRKDGVFGRFELASADDDAGTMVQADARSAGRRAPPGLSQAAAPGGASAPWRRSPIAPSSCSPRG